jgi:hypothetical protein
MDGSERQACDVFRCSYKAQHDSGSNPLEIGSRSSRLRIVDRSSFLGERPCGWEGQKEPS